MILWRLICAPGPFRSAVLLTLLVVVVAPLPRSAAWAADVAAPDAEPAPENADGQRDAETEEDERFLRGADLNTDYEADSLLRRAREFLAAPEPRYHQAAMLLQHLIDTAGNALATEDGMVYRPIREKAEELLAQFPALGLDSYRAEVDGQILALLGPLERNRDARALAIVAERFFLSTQGDDAAFLLGCLYLDQHQYVRARRVLLRILRSHPDPSVPRSHLLLRLALACHRSGDAEGARTALEQIADCRGPMPADEAVASVRREVLAKTPPSTEAAAEPQAPVRGRFPDLPAESLQRPRGLWIPRNRQEFSLIPPSPNVRVRIGHTIVQGGSKSNAAVREHLAIRWEQCGWFPTGQMLVRDGVAWFKTHDSVVCLDTRTDKVRWEAKPKKEKTNRTHYVSFSTSAFQQNRPVQPHEALLFGDRLGKRVGIVGDTLYHIADQDEAQWHRSHVFQQVVVVNGKRVVREAKKMRQGNRLVALDPDTGKVRWQIGRTLDEGDPVHAVRFRALPILCGGRLLVPVETQGELELVALEPRTREIAWRTFLCAYTASTQAPWYGVGFARRGSDIYVSTGQGVMLAVDGFDGSMRWASRYERRYAEDAPVNIFQGRNVVGWHESHVIPWGRRLVVLPSDADSILVFDVQSGALERELPAEDMRYLVGLSSDSLFAASGESVQRIALPTGETLWRLEPGAGPSYGRGFLADDALYIPNGHDILRVDASTGEVETRLHVALPDDEPVGNVFCDGEALFVYGLGRVYSLKNGAEEMLAVARRVDTLEKQRAAAVPAPKELLAKLGDAYLARARLHLGYGRTEAAADDYRTVLQDLGRGKAADAARDALLGILLALVEAQPDRAEGRVREAREIARTTEQKAKALRSLAAVQERAGHVVEAARTFLAMANLEKDDLVELEDGKETWLARPDVAAAAGLRRLADRHGERIKPFLTATSATALEAARRKPSFAAFQTILRTFPGTPAAIEAGLAAADQAARHTVERAELILREMVASVHRPTAAAGLARLAELHQGQGWLRQARAGWSQLAEDFGDISVPATDGARNAGDLARERLADPLLAAAVDGDDGHGVPPPPWRLVWEIKPDDKVRYISAVSYAAQNPSPPHLASQFMDDHLFVLHTHSTSKVICVRLRDGKTVLERDIGNGRRQYPLCPEANIVAWVGQKDMTVFGLISGKELWSGKMGTADSRSIQLRRSTVSRQSAASAATVLGLHPDSSTVRAIDLATGRAMWERSLRGRAVGWAGETGRYFLLSANSNRELYVLDVFTGKVAGAIDFEGRYRSLTHVSDRGLLCQTYTRTGEHTLALYDLASGKPMWEYHPEQMVRNTTFLDADAACLLYVNGDLEILDLASGKVRTKFEQVQTGGHVVRAEPDPKGKRLYLQVYTADRKTQLRTIDLETGKQTRSVTYSQGLSHAFRRIAIGAHAGDLIPVVVRDPAKKEGNRVRSSNLSQVKFIEASTGLVREELKLPVGRKDGKVEKLRQVIVGDGVIVLVGYNWLKAFGHDGVAQAPAK
jgi:outer membrane protein assembly factor BamB